MHSHRIEDAHAAYQFMTAGKSIVTLVSTKTGTRFTYKISAPKDDSTERPSIRFVGVLSGPDNSADYQYIGFIGSEGTLIAGRKGLPGAASFKALAWALPKLSIGRMPEGLEIWHEGKCGRCGRRLTVPASIATGFGPECAAVLEGLKPPADTVLPDDPTRIPPRPRKAAPDWVRGDDLDDLLNA